MTRASKGTFTYIIHIHTDTATKMQKASIFFTETSNLTARNAHIYTASTTIKIPKKINYCHKNLQFSRQNNKVIISTTRAEPGEAVEINHAQEIKVKQKIAIQP